MRPMKIIGGSFQMCNSVHMASNSLIFSGSFLTHPLVNSKYFLLNRMT
jgi:hypothetical protein